jgi:seryl-tRNA synthetase
MNVEGAWVEVKRSLETTLDKLFDLKSHEAIEYDSVLTLAEITALGYPRNFPQLTCLLCAIDPGHRQEVSDGAVEIGQNYSPSATQMALLPAACYKAYLQRRNTELSEPCMVGCVARCFRFEDKPLDTYRAFNFTMKEFVCIGSTEDARWNVERGKVTIEEFMTALRLPFSIETATDPFFDKSSAVATLSRAMPTKQEIMFEGHAVASLNSHRNYFGKKFDISLRGEPVNTSCVAFGLERWISMLRDAFGDPQIALQRLRAFQGDSLSSSPHKQALNGR